MINLPTWYDAGTVSVAGGGTTVTLAGGFWGDDGIMVGDLFCDPAQPLVPPQRIKEVTDETTIELWAPWPGADMTADPYEIRYVGIIERSTAQSRRVLEQLGDVKAWYDVIVEDDAARLALESPSSPLRAGYRVLVKDAGVIWAKEASAYGDWIGPVEFKGDKGDQGDIGPRGVTPRGGYSGATAYVEGDAVLDNGSSWVALQPTTGNAPPTLPATSNAYWELMAQKGQDGTGTGDVVGPPSSVTDYLALFDGVTGKLLKSSAALPDARVSATLTADKAFRRGNIVGTVSQSGGVPTGALMEIGTNYLRLANGFQACWGSVVIGGDGWKTNGQTVNYAASFSATPSIQLTANPGDPGYAGIAEARYPSGTGFLLLAPGGITDTGTSAWFGWVAVGKWF